MSHLCCFTQMINNYCKDDPEIEDLLKKIEALEKENAFLQPQHKEYERENLRLQMELFNVETMLQPLQQLPAEECIEKHNMQLMETCASLRYAIYQIDFGKIVQGNHNQMEQSYRKEWQQLQDYTVSMLKWHEKMESRSVVQQYRKVERVFKEMEQNFQKFQTDHQKSIKTHSTRISEAKQKTKTLVLHLVDGSKYLDKFKELDQSVHIMLDLNKQKAKLQEHWENGQNNTSNTMAPYNVTQSNDNSKPGPGVMATFKYDMPKFPSFNDIIQSFNLDLNQEEVVPKITMVENTTNIMIRSILRNSQDNSMEINQSITTKHTKHVHFKMQLEDRIELKGQELIASDYSSDDSAVTKIEVPPPSKNVQMQNQMQTADNTPVVDLLTPSDSPTIVTKEIQSAKLPEKAKINILECIVIKPQASSTEKIDYCLENNKENISPNGKAERSFQIDAHGPVESLKEIMPPPQKPGANRKNRNMNKKSSGEEFPNVSLSMETSSDESPTYFGVGTNDIEKYFRGNSDITDFIQIEENEGVSDDKNNEVMANSVAEELDFGGKDLFFDASDGDDPFARGSLMDFFS